MYDIKLFTINANKENNMLGLYNMMVQAGLIAKPAIFCDTISVLSEIPRFHTFHLLTQNYLLLTDNSVNMIADTFNSNKFICIDIPSRFSYPNVDYYSLEDFYKKTPETNIKTVQEILNKGYQKYVVL